VWARKMAVRVFHFSIMFEKVNTAMALKTSPQLVFFILKTGKKGIIRHNKFSEVKVVYKTPRKDYIFSNFLSFKEF